MISFSRIADVILEQSKRILKVKQFGVKTAKECSPFGEDSSPLENMVAIYADTSNNSESVIIGYINSNQLAGPGEKRIFSLKTDGSLSTSVWLKTDETIEIGGNTNTTVRYVPLNTGLQQQVLSINAELSKIATAINSVAPGAYTLTPITLDITSSNSDKIKIP